MFKDSIMNGYLSRAAAGALFLAGFFFVHTATATDVSIYSVAKGIYFEQTSAAPPAVLTNNGYIFSANVALTGAGTVRSALVQAPGGTNQALSADGSDSFEFKKKYNTRA